MRCVPAINRPTIWPAFANFWARRGRGRNSSGSTASPWVLGRAGFQPHRLASINSRRLARWCFSLFGSKLKNIPRAGTFRLVWQMQQKSSNNTCFKTFAFFLPYYLSLSSVLGTLFLYVALEGSSASKLLYTCTHPSKQICHRHLDGL